LVKETSLLSRLRGALAHDGACDSDRGGLSVALSLSTTRITLVLPLALLIEESVALTDALYCIVKEEVKGNHKTRLSLG
jgi:hypothetical protein